MKRKLDHNKNYKDVIAQDKISKLQLDIRKLRNKVETLKEEKKMIEKSFLK